MRASSPGPNGWPTPSFRVPKPRDVFITGLRNAHSVEVKSTQLLERQIQALSDYPDIRARLEQHLGETRTQLDRLENILGQLDESPSTIKDTLLAAFGNALVLPQGMAGDAILKSAFASFAFENYEVAAYRSLITMTELVGMQQQFRALLEASLNEELKMAQWVGDNISAMTRRYLAEIEEPTGAQVLANRNEARAPEPAQPTRLEQASRGDVDREAGKGLRRSNKAKWLKPELRVRAQHLKTKGTWGHAIVMLDDSVRLRVA